MKVALVQINVNVQSRFLKIKDWKKAIGKSILKAPECHIRKVKAGLQKSLEITSRGDIIVFPGWTVPLAYSNNFLKRASTNRTVFFEQIIDKKLRGVSYVYKNGKKLVQDSQYLGLQKHFSVFERLFLSENTDSDYYDEYLGIKLFHEPHKRFFKLRNNVSGLLLLCGEANLAKTSSKDKKTGKLKSEEYIYNVADGVNKLIDISHFVFNPSHTINPPGLEAMRRKRGFIASNTKRHKGKHWLFQIANGHISPNSIYRSGYLSKTMLRTAELYFGKRPPSGGKYLLQPTYPENVEKEKQEGFTIYLVDTKTPSKIKFITKK